MKEQEQYSSILGMGTAVALRMLISCLCAKHIVYAIVAMLRWRTEKGSLCVRIGMSALAAYQQRQCIDEPLQGRHRLAPARWGEQCLIEYRTCGK